MAEAAAGAEAGSGAGAVADDSLPIMVRYGCKDPKEVRIKRSWTLKKAREHIAEELDIQSKVNILFSGKIVEEDVTVEELGLSDMTTLDLAKAQGLKLNLLSISVMDNNPNFVEQSAEDLLGAGNEVNPDTRQCFYVYCRRECKAVQEAKLRVRCKTCGLTQLVVHKDPGGWDDLEGDKIEGECQAPNCPGTIAEFFFKCGGHRAKEDESFPPLKRVVTNTRKTPCIICMDDDKEILYVFECPDRHVICFECLKQHLLIKIQNRDLKLVEHHGYTLSCVNPADECRTCYITDPQTFKIVGEEVYQKYQLYGTQEWVLKQGGVLCPAPNCAAGLLPDGGMRKIKCTECKFEFCLRCKQDFHEGDCDIHSREVAERIAEDPNISPEQAARARRVLADHDVMSQECKQCPGCKSKIYKTEGCNHMTCSQCKFEFCWLCLVAWSATGCQRRHWFSAEP